MVDPTTAVIAVELLAVQTSAQIGLKADSMDNQAIAPLLREIIAQQREILAELRRGMRAEPEPSLDQRTKSRLTPLLPAIWSTLGTQNFTTAELFKLVALANDASLEVDQNLPGAVAGAIGAIDKGGPKRLGRLLCRASGHEIAGLRVERLSSERLGVLWSIKKSGSEFCEFPRVSKAAKPAKARDTL